MASSSAPRLQTYLAGSAIAANTFVKFGADKTKVVPCGSNDRPIGIAQNAQATVGGKVDVALPGGGGKLKVVSTTVVSSRLYADTNALGKVCDGASKFIGAIAYEDGVANDIIGVEVTAAHESVATD